MGALDVHTLVSTQALNSSRVQGEMKDILLNHAGLYETLRGLDRAPAKRHESVFAFDALLVQTKPLRTLL